MGDRIFIKITVDITNIITATTMTSQKKCKRRLCTKKKIKLPKNVKEDCAARKSQIMTKDLWLTSKPLPIDTPELRIYKMTSKNDTFSIRMGFLHLHWKPIFLRRVNNFFRKRPVWNGSVYFDVFTLLATENKTLLYFHPHRRHKCGQKS